VRKLSKQPTVATDLFQHRFTVFSSIIQPIKLFLCFSHYLLINRWK